MMMMMMMMMISDLELINKEKVFAILRILPFQQATGWKTKKAKWLMNPRILPEN